MNYRPDWYRTHDDSGKPFYPLKFYLERLKNNKPFTRVCFGDGEMRLIIDESTMINLRGGEKTPELKEAFYEAVKYIKNDSDNFFFVIVDQDKAADYLGVYNSENPEGKKIYDLLEKVGLKGYKFHPALIFFYAVLNGQFKPFIEQFNKMNVVIAAPAENRCLKEKGLNYDYYIDTYITQDYGRSQWKHVLEKCLEYGKPAVYLIGCGEASAIITTKLHKKIPNSFFIDTGKFLDFLAESRFWGHDIAEGTPTEKEKKRQEQLVRIRSNFP